MNHNSLHIEFERLTDLIVGTLSDAEKSDAETHLATCAICTAKKARVEKFVGVMQSDRLEEVPSHILERSFDLLRERKPPTEKPSLLGRLSAVLQSENSWLTPAFGLRSGQTDTARRLWLTADDAEIDLRLKQTGEKWDVDGQVFGSLIGGEAVLQSESNVFKTELSDLCEFSFAEIPGGVYRLIFYFGGTEIEIPRLGLEP